MSVDRFHGGDVTAFLDARDAAMEVVHRSADITKEVALQNADYAVINNLADFRQGKAVMEAIVEGSIKLES